MERVIKVEEMIGMTMMASTARNRARDDAREAARKICRDLEVALQRLTTADGELRGLPNLGTSKRPSFLARVRGDRLDADLGEPQTGFLGPETLCLDAHGRLVMARKVRERQVGMCVESRPCRDDELMAEDAENVAECAVAVLQEHCRKLHASGERYKKLHELTTAISEALDRVLG